MASTYQKRDKRKVNHGHYLLREQIRLFDGIALERARDTRSDKPVLAKVVKDRSAQELAQWEYWTLDAVHHPLIIRPRDRVKDKRDYSLYLYDAETFVLAERPSEATLEATELARSLFEILLALHDAGFARLGISTKSFWLRPRDGVFVPALVDLRAAWDVPGRSIYRPNAIPHDRPKLRSPAGIIAPEVLLGRETDCRSDIYAVGAVLYELLSGIPPLSATDAWTVLDKLTASPPKPLRQVRSDVPVAVSDVVDRCLAFSPADRFASASEAIELLSGSARRAPAVTPPALLLSPEFAGREKALASFQETFRKSDGFRLVGLEGEYGAGKNRFVRELLAALKLEGVGTCRLSFSDGDRSLYFQPFESLFSALFPPGGRSVSSEMERVAVHLFPGRLRSGKRRSRDRTPPFPRRESIVSTLSQMILAVAPHGGPICLVLDDVPGDDADVATLIESLGKTLKDRPVLVMVSLRAGEGELAPIYGTPIRFGKMESGTIQRVIRSALGSPMEPDASIASQADGNPFAALELLRGGAVEEGSGTPATIISSRLRPLGEEAKLCLESAAVLGRVFDRSMLLRISELTEDVMWEQVRLLTKMDLLRCLCSAGRLSFRFAHPLYREIVLAEASPARRALLHRRTARLIEAQSKRGGATQPFDLALHYAQGEDDGKAAKYCALAADRAADLFAGGAAMRFYQMGAETGVEDERLDRVKTKIAGLLAVLGRGEAEVGAAAPGEPAVEPPSIDRLLHDGEAALAATEYPRARKLLRQAVDAGEADVELRSRGLRLLGVLARRLGDSESARKSLEEAAGLAPEGTSEAALSRIDLGRALFLLGEEKKAVERIEEGIRVAEAMESSDLVGLGQASIGFLLAAVSRRDEALDRLRNASEDCPDGMGGAWIWSALGVLAEEGRQDDEAFRAYVKAEEVSPAQGPHATRARFRALVGRARALTRLDRLDDAREVIRSGGELCRRPGAIDLAWKLHFEEARVYRMEGRLDEALRAGLRAGAALESLMEQARLAGPERTLFLRHGGRLKCYRILLAVRLLMDRTPSLIEFAPDDDVVQLIERFSGGRQEPSRKLPDRLEQMTAWVLEHRDQIRVGSRRPVNLEFSEGGEPVKVLPARPSVPDRREAKSLLRLQAILLSLKEPGMLEAHLLDMVLDVTGADSGVFARFEGASFHPIVSRELEGKEIERAVSRLNTLKGRRDLDGTGPLLGAVRRREGGPTSLLLPIVRAASLKAGIYVEGTDVRSLDEEDKRYLKQLAALAVLALSASQEQKETADQLASLSRENRGLQQEVARLQAALDRDRRKEPEPNRDRPNEPEPKEAEAPTRLSRRARRAQEKQEIIAVLREEEWSRKAAAGRLGISRNSLNTKLRRYNIRIGRLREQEEAALAPKQTDAEIASALAEQPEPAPAASEE